MIVVPLVFSSLVVGVAGIGDIRKLGRVGLKSFVYCFVISAISVVIGLTLANTIRPGERIDPATKAALEQRYATDATKTGRGRQEGGRCFSTPLMQVVETIVPSNPFACRGASIPAAIARTPNMLHLMFFALMIGIAITLIPVKVTAPLLSVLEGSLRDHCEDHRDHHEVCAYAVACLLFNNTARFGLDLLQALAWFVVTVLLGLSLHMFGVYSLSIYFLSRCRRWSFSGASRP